MQGRQHQIDIYSGRHLDFSHISAMLCREMLVQWTTRDVGNPLVHFGKESGKLKHTVKAHDSVTYLREEMCGPPASTVGYVDPGRMHRALLQDLEPDTRFFYTYGDEVSCRKCTWRL